jgi:hypothetical protein
LLILVTLRFWATGRNHKNIEVSTVIQLIKKARKAAAKKHRDNTGRKSHTLPPDTNVPPREEHFNLQLAKKMSQIEDKIRNFTLE